MEKKVNENITNCSLLCSYTVVSKIFPFEDQWSNYLIYCHLMYVFKLFHMKCIFLFFYLKKNRNILRETVNTLDIYGIQLHLGYWKIKKYFIRLTLNLNLFSPVKIKIQIYSFGNVNVVFIFCRYLYTEIHRVKISIVLKRLHLMTLSIFHILNLLKFGIFKEKKTGNMIPTAY